MMNYRVGIDVGGTNTDAVILDNNNEVVAETKVPTTDKVGEGINEALRKGLSLSSIPREQVNYAMLGTTHCTNAIVERKNLNNIAVVRIGAPATLAVKPLISVPNDLRDVLGRHVYVVRGGNEFDGREIAELDEAYLYEIANQVKNKVDSIAITSVFSPVSKEHEQKAGEIFKEVLGEDTPISLSSEIGSVGLLERENATILNTSVVNVAKAAAEGFQAALKQENIDVSVYFSQNDGTLMSVEYAIKYPIFTVACGPTNSLRGASYLSNLKHAIVVDVGGTTTDIGVLVQSFPRESSLAVEIGGARTNFRMPDLISIGLGGGTIIHLEENGSFAIGPDSVGYQIHEKALIFGGDVLTATDVAVGLGKVDIGDSTQVKHLSESLLKDIYDQLLKMVEDAIDKMKTSAQDTPVILVGGGSVILPESLQGASQVYKPKHSAVSNAIGSVIAQISGQVEKVYVLDEIGREKALDNAKEIAEIEAVDAGANKDSLEVIDIEDVPLAYLPGNATLVRCKVAGNLL